VAKKKTCKPTPRKTRHTDRFYQGRFPRYKLLIGQYLYYSGIISWQTLINAVIWQKKQRPMFGQIACQWGILSNNDVSRILRNRQYHEKIGQYALRAGYISPFQLMAIKGRQRILHQPIGNYFIEQSIVTPEQMDGLIKKMTTHNFSIRAS
jgi:hypothetical protein